MKTRYYSNKGDTFFSRLPKDDQDQSINDGRELRHWTFGDDSGTTLGYIEKELNGFVESLYFDKDFDGVKQICVGLQTSEGVKVYQFPLKDKYNSLHSHTVALAMVHESLDLEFPLGLSIFLGKASAKGYQKPYLNLSQARKALWPSYKKVEGSKFDYEGVPPVVKREEMGETVYDSKERDIFLYAKLEELMAKVDAAGHKKNREPSEAEVAAVLPSGLDDDSEDMPF
jgi:hypothetical protein